MNQREMVETEFPGRKTPTGCLHSVARALLLMSLLSVGGMPLLSCTTTSPQTVAHVPVAPQQDAEYAPVLKKWTKEATVTERFQKKIDTKVVLFTDEFRRAYTSRWIRLHGDTSARLPEELGNGRLGVLVSVFTPERPYLNMEDANLWTLRLRYGPTLFAPSVVRPLSEKALFEPYFPFISSWTSEYLVIFETENGVAAGSAESPLPANLEFSMRSALVNLAFAWQ